ncbi:MAG TPA: hypothetical protein PKG52_01965 [bacterium]|nr:hypothetical protein [bacterium]HPS29060.1 hypothetical protein [bacterium]
MIEKKRQLKTRKIEVMCTDEHFETISKKARKYGMSNSEFGLFTMLNSRIDISLGTDPILSKISTAIEMLESGNITDDEFSAIKKKIIEEVKG